MQFTKFLFSSFILVGALSTTIARADISVFVLDSEGVADHVTNGGHTVLGLSDICAESPTKLRLCTDSDTEKGVVINKMQHLSAENYNWIATPIDQFLYGASSRATAPLIVNKTISDADNQKRYDDYYSQSIQSSDDKGRWTKSVGALFARTVYEYRLPGFYDDEVAIMNALNTSLNKSNYNVILNNCADFVGKNLKPIFKTSLAESVDGGGIHSPKALAMNLTKLGIEKPELNMQVIKYPQLSGTFSRSTLVMAPSENLYKNPFFAVPIGIFVPEIPLVALALNEVFRRFHQDSAYVKSLTPEQREAILGTPAEWKSYKSEFHDTVTRAKNDSSLPAEIHELLASSVNDKDVPKKLMTYFSTNGKFTTSGDNVEMSLQIQGEAQPRMVGMTRETVSTGDKQIGYLVMMADLGQTIYERARVRSSMEDFKKDWSLFQSLLLDNSRNPASVEVNDDVYDHLFPYYTTQCAVGQMVKKSGDIGGEYGHSLFYVKGLCRDTTAAYPKVKMCEAGDPAGAVVSLDSIYLNTSFIAIDGRDSLFNAGLGRDQPLTQEFFDQVVDKALKAGVSKGVTLVDGNTSEEAVTRMSTQTDWAVSFARDAACVRIPLNHDQVQAMVDSLNAGNKDYVSGKKTFVWNEFTNNCTILVRDTFAKIGLRKPIENPHNVFGKLAEARKSELPIPAMDLVKTIESVNDVNQIDTADKVYANQELRNDFNNFNSLPAARGGTVEFVPMHDVNNELYGHGAKMIFDKLSKGVNEAKWNKFLADSQYTSLETNLNHVLDRFKTVQSQRKASDDTTSDLGKFTVKYNTWVDQSILDLEQTIAEINAAQPSL